MLRHSHNDKILAKSQQTKLTFNPELRGCEWRLDKPIKVSAGQPYDDELIAILNFTYENAEGKLKSVSFETDLKMLKALLIIVKNQTFLTYY